MTNIIRISEKEKVESRSKEGKKRRAERDDELKKFLEDEAKKLKLSFLPSYIVTLQIPDRWNKLSIDELLYNECEFRNAIDGLFNFLKINFVIFGNIIKILFIEI